MRVLTMFLGAGEGKLARVDGNAEAFGRANGEKVKMSTALITGLHRAAITYQGNIYEMGPKTFDPIESSFEQAVGGGTAADPYACLEAVSGIDISRLAGRVTDRVTTSGGQEIKGVYVTTVLKPSALQVAFHELTEAPACSAQLRMAGSLWGQLDRMAEEFEARMEEAEVRTFVDKSGLLREIWVKALLGSKGDGRTEAEFAYSLSHVNEVDELPPCTGEKPISALFRKLGFNPLKAIEAGSPGLAGLLKGIYAGALA